MSFTVEYPTRINKYLSEKGYVSRRKADELISRGLISINGKTAQLGDIVNEGDVVDVSGEAQRIQDSFVYYAFNKPRGIVSSNPQGNEKEIRDVFKTKENVSVVGRLDKDSTGLILLTNDGRITHRLLSPEFEHEKEYRVKVQKPLKERVVRIFQNGMNIEGVSVRPADAEIIGEKTLKVVLTEGKHHQIRRMLAALGYEVVSLERVRIMNIHLGNLKSGEGRALSEKEKRELLSSLGL
jgi:23S rRNA pseudouridine2604 synthase